MSLDSFIRLYQELLTMVDPNNEMSVEYAVNVLRQIMILARQSHKVDPLTERCMFNGINEFPRIARHRDDFAGKPGDYAVNAAKRQRLRHMLVPHC